MDLNVHRDIDLNTLEISSEIHRFKNHLHLILPSPVHLLTIRQKGYPDLESSLRTFFCVPGHLVKRARGSECTS